MPYFFLCRGLCRGQQHIPYCKEVGKILFITVKLTEEGIDGGAGSVEMAASHVTTIYFFKAFRRLDSTMSLKRVAKVAVLNDFNRISSSIVVLSQGQLKLLLRYIAFGVHLSVGLARMFE